MNEIIKNPLVKNGKVNLLANYDSKKVVSSYSKLGIDVNRFFKNKDTFSLYKCEISGYKFYYPFSIIGDADFYKDLSLNRKSYYSTRWEHTKILPTITKSEKVLEIGSGFGAFLKLLESKSIDAEGIELNPEAIVKCKKENLKVYDELINEFSKKNIEKYDVVCYFQVLEHITNVYDFIKESLETLKPNGKLIIGVPNNNPFLFVNNKYHTLNLPPHHAGLWSRESLTSLTKIFDIKLQSIYFEPLEFNYKHFLNHQIKHNKYRLIRNGFKIVSKTMPSILKKTCCTFINGRNVVAVFKKQ